MNHENDKLTSIVIVNWNTRDLLLAAVGSIVVHERPEAVEIIVVDNASSDDSVSAVRARYPDVVIVQNPGNLGYAKACNAGIRRAKGRYIFILNSDTTLIEPVCQKLIAFVKAHQDAFAVGPMLVYPDNHQHQPSCRRFPTPALWLLLSLRVRRLAPRWSVFRDFEMETLDKGQTAAVPQIMGAAMFFERAKLDKVGFFDERFWMYMEEVDLCKRGCDAGYRNYYYPEVRITHALSRSAAKLRSAVKMAAVQRSALQYYHKHFGQTRKDRLLAMAIWSVTKVFLTAQKARFDYDWRGEQPRELGPGARLPS